MCLTMGESIIIALLAIAVGVLWVCEVPRRARYSLTALLTIVAGATLWPRREREEHETPILRPRIAEEIERAETIDETIADMDDGAHGGVDNADVTRIRDWARRDD